MGNLNSMLKYNMLDIVDEMINGESLNSTLEETTVKVRTVWTNKGMDRG
jgi:hypothetical protein